MSFLDDLFEELSAAVKRERCVDPFSFPNDTLPGEDQLIEPVCTTFTEGRMVHMYRVLDGSCPEELIFSIHGDRGVVSDYGGPYASLEDAQKPFEPVDEPWTYY